MTFHPKLDEHGLRVFLHRPCIPTSIESWSNAVETATVIPDGDLPPELNGVRFCKWSDAPRSADTWERLAAQSAFSEPLFLPPKHKKPAAGVVVEESDGRVWLVAPSNGHAGYVATFPKGTIENGASRQATAIKEAFEETGLRVELTGFFADSDRSTSFTRYYFARRIGGSPADMGWESQAVHLVPKNQLAEYLFHKYDLPLLEVVLDAIHRNTKASLLRSPTLDSGHRIRQAVDGYRSRYGRWPARVSMPTDMADAIKQHTLTDMGWAMLVSKLEVRHIPEMQVIVEGESGERFEYGEAYEPPSDGSAADIWIWGCRLS
jgi:8-oxo-dGTP pyrophosphatase MutT (NUDIX family)